MTTTARQLPDFDTIATGGNIEVQAGNPAQYLVARIAPYPNANLVVGKTYNISDPNHMNGIVVRLVYAPGGGMQTATFQQQT
ncbi:hypothetical protein [Xanthomonas sp. WHRI 6106]|uniref:hypothetical protein n=1 Tax=Xanthomonas sp. WHRI 6106 TaxID=3161566 RepID=UPI0032E92AB5